MTPFLQQIAGIYAREELDSLGNYCFVFPNKRSATFFQHYLKEALSDNVAFLPKITNISEFIASQSDLQQATRYELLFTLFNEYNRLLEKKVEFEQFIFWGEMLLSDFNEVDQYLVDVDRLFVNLQRYKEISANFLTPQQIEVIERYWGENRSDEAVGRFWKHIDGKKDAQKKFLQLWEVLRPLYHAYRDILESEGLASSGMLYRNAVDRLSALASADELEFKRYIFVGFNVLSTSETHIFKSLQRLGAADFYWDFNSPALRMDDSRAAKFIAKNIRQFPSLYQLEETEIDHLPNISIIGVPSNIGQVKEAGEIIGKWTEQGLIEQPENALDTSVVLPDESLLIPMIHSIPDVIESINVTMGFPMKLSPMSTLVRNIVSLQLRSRIQEGQRRYFYEDVNTLLTAGAIRSIAPEKIEQLKEIIRRDRLFTIPASLIIETVGELEPIFHPIDDSDNIENIRLYIERLCEFLRQNVATADMAQEKFIESYLNASAELFDAAKRFNIRMKGNSFFKLVERAIASDTIRFSGEPLSGLQVMGVLETRALDFRNIIMLSMNERVFPRRQYSRSFIPNALRHGYGMATIDFQESIFAYYFYRLISRAENVTLIYDARSVGGNRSNEISRYLAQLLYFFGKERISHSLKNYKSQRFTRGEISIAKDDRIMKLIDRYRAGGPKNLSASTLNEYISCPLGFYLKNIEGFNAEDEINDYIDSSTYGTIVHNLAQRIYQTFQDAERNPVTVTESMLSPLTKKDNPTLDIYITEEINRIYNHYSDDRLRTPLVGETLILGRVIREALTAMLREDIKLCPFSFVAAEKEMTGTLTINPTLSINFKQIIDRIDIAQGTMRFVDYKTGMDLMRAPSIPSMFNGESSARAKAIMQLMLYCHIYNTFNNSDQPIKPLIYKILDIPKRGVESLKINRQAVTDYHEFSDEFVENLNVKIEEIFNPDVKFTQTKKERNCTFCQFKALCGRE